LPGEIPASPLPFSDGSIMRSRRGQTEKTGSVIETPQAERDRRVHDDSIVYIPAIGEARNPTGFYDMPSRVDYGSLLICAHRTIGHSQIVRCSATCKSRRMRRKSCRA